MIAEPTPERTVPLLADAEGGSIVPDWLTNTTALGWRILIVVGMVVVLWLVASTLWVVSATLALSIIVSAVLAPSVVRLRNRGHSRTSAALIVWATGMLVILGVLVALALLFLPSAVEMLQQIKAGVVALQGDMASAHVPPAVQDIVSTVTDTATSGSGGVVQGIVSSAAAFVTVCILSVFLVFFLLQDGDRGWVWAFQAFGSQKRETIMSAGSEALTRVGGYLRGTTILAAAVALTSFLFMLVLGVPLAVPLTILAFLAGYIPVFGGIVASLVILLVTYAALGLDGVILMVILMGVRNVILSYLVRPTVYGRSVSIHPALVLIVLPAGYELAGAMGLFAAVPLTAVVLAASSAFVSIVEPIPRPPLPGIVPAWLDRVAQWSWRLFVVMALAILCVAFAATMPLVVTPVILALVLTATLDPMVVGLIHRGWSRVRATALTLVGGTLLVIGILALTALALLDQVDDIVAQTNLGAARLNELASGQLGLGTAGTAQGMEAVAQAALSLAQAAATVGVILVFSLLLTFYFLKDGGGLWQRVVDRIHTGSRDEVDGAGNRAFDVLSGYMIGTAAISFVGAASQWFIMVVLGIPLALPVAVLSFILCFIPYIGGFISTGIAFLLTVAVGTPLDILIMAGWTIVFNIVQGNIVSPLVYGKTVHLHPAVVLLAIPAAAGVGGIMGMFIVVPALGVVAATWRPVLALLAARRGDGSPDAQPSSIPSAAAEGATSG